MPYFYIIWAQNGKDQQAMRLLINFENLFPLSVFLIPKLDNADLNAQEKFSPGPYVYYLKASIESTIDCQSWFLTCISTQNLVINFSETSLKLIGLIFVQK